MKAENLWKWLALVGFLLAVLVFSYLKTVDSDNPRFPIQWTQSQWISFPGTAPNGYFRHDFMLESEVDKAIIQLAATDAYELFINGRRIDIKERKSMVAAGLYDISHLLDIGKNTVAVAVKLKSYPANTALRFEIRGIDQLGRPVNVMSDSGVTVQPMLPAGNGELLWYEQELDISAWPLSQTVQGPKDITLTGVNPQLLMMLPEPAPKKLSGSGNWRVSAVKTFWYEGKQSKQVWAGFSSEVPYEIIVNGISLGLEEPNPHSIDLQAIQSRLKEGENKIQVEFTTGGEPAIVAGLVAIDGHHKNQFMLLNNEWQVTGTRGTGLPTQQSGLNTAGLGSSVMMLEPSAFPELHYRISESFVPPQLLQSGPWLNIGQYVFALLILMMAFRALGLRTQYLLDATLMANLIGITGLLLAWFVAQDVRFDARRIFGEDSLDMLLIVWLCMVFAALIDRYRVSVEVKRPLVKDHQPSRINHISFWVMGIAIVLVAFFLRLDELGARPLTIDEATIAGFARGVMERGYPYLMVGGMQVNLATYELVPYPLAASLSLFGYSDFALRLPALIFGALTCGLIIFCGTKWFGRMAGLLAGILYAVSPWAIYWGQNAFHPAQTQFFNLLALVVFYRLLSADKISLKLAALSALAFAFTYLSWEGTGMVLPIMALVALVVRWRQWSWFTQVNLWIAGLLIIIVVAAQGIRRTLLESAYTKIGFGKSDTSLPSITFTDPTYEPFYYFNNFFFIEPHISLSIFFFIGFLLMFFDRKLSFVVLFVTMAYVTLTNMLGYYNAHYFYFVFPIFLIAVAAVFTKLLMLIQGYFAQVGGVVVKLQGVLVAVLLAMLLVIPSSTDVLHMYRLQADAIDRLRIDYRSHLAAVDLRANSEFLQTQYREGDVVITNLPLVVEHYIGKKGDYFLQTITNRKVVYDTVNNTQFYVDKFVGNPVLRSKDELEEVFERHDRVFLIAAPVGGLRRLIDEETLNYINKNMRVISESYDSRLYLWEK